MNTTLHRVEDQPPLPPPAAPLRCFVNRNIISPKTQPRFSLRFARHHAGAVAVVIKQVSFDQNPRRPGWPQPRRIHHAEIWPEPGWKVDRLVSASWASHTNAASSRHPSPIYIVLQRGAARQYNGRLERLERWQQKVQQKNHPQVRKSASYMPPCP